MTRAATSDVGRAIIENNNKIIIIIILLCVSHKHAVHETYIIRITLRVAIKAIIIICDAR